MPFTTVGDHPRWAKAAGLAWPLPEGEEHESPVDREPYRLTPTQLQRAARTQRSPARRS
jgi:hypothetical protein